jgi:hypothetical protein
MATIEELQAELALLREQVSRLTVALLPPKQEKRVLTRRNLLRAAPVAAISAGIAARSASPASAAVGGAVLLGKVNNASTSTTTLDGGTTNVPALAVNGGASFDSDVTIGNHSIYGYGAQALDIVGKVTLAGPLAIDGTVPSEFTALTGVDALKILTQGPGTGLTVTAMDGTHGSTSQDTLPSVGVAITSGTAAALTARSSGQVVTVNSTDTTNTVDAVTVSYAGKGRGVYAESTLATNLNGTITGVNDGPGTGVWGESRGAGFGVVGYGGAHGRGAQLTSNILAQARLVPGTLSTHPATGKQGDLYVDRTGRLWYCQTTAGTTWKQLA